MSYRIKDLPEEEKPREKAKKIGFENLSTIDLLSILLRTGTKAISVKDLSIELLNTCGGLEGLLEIRLPKLTEIKGIGETKAITLLAAIELGKRLKRKETSKQIQIKETKDVYEYYKDLFEGVTQEKFFVLFLSSKNQVIEEKTIFIGTANQSLVHPRDIFKEAILQNAVKILCVHNHPSGDTTPSKEDKEMTKRLKECGNLLGIPILDHVILSENSYYSFLERGLL